MAATVEHWFNRHWGMARRDVYLLRTETGWQVLGREGGSNGREIPYYFEVEKDARTMVDAMKRKVAPELSNWAKVNERPPALGGDH